MEIIEDFDEWGDFWFDWLRPWKSIDVNQRRLIWTEWIGVPLHVWNVRFFSLACSNLGLFIKLDEESQHKIKLDTAKVLISTGLKTIDRIMEIRIDGALFSIRVSELICSGCVRDKLATAKSNSDSNSESDSQYSMEPAESDGLAEAAIESPKKSDGSDSVAINANGVNASTPVSMHENLEREKGTWDLVADPNDIALEDVRNLNLTNEQNPHKRINMSANNCNEEWAPAKENEKSRFASVGARGNIGLPNRDSEFRNRPQPVINMSPNSNKVQYTNRAQGSEENEGVKENVVENNCAPAGDSGSQYSDDVGHTNYSIQPRPIQLDLKTQSTEKCDKNMEGNRDPKAIESEESGLIRAKGKKAIPINNPVSMREEATRRKGKRKELSKVEEKKMEKRNFSGFIVNIASEEETQERNKSNKNRPPRLNEDAKRTKE